MFFSDFVVLSNRKRCLVRVFIGIPSTLFMALEYLVCQNKPENLFNCFLDIKLYIVLASFECLNPLIKIRGLCTRWADMCVNNESSELNKFLKSILIPYYQICWNNTVLTRLHLNIFKRWILVVNKKGLLFLHLVNKFSTRIATDWI